MAKKVICPLLKKPCIEHECQWFTSIRGYDVNTGKDVDNNQCIVTVIPMLLIENSAQQRSTSSAVESLRNEVVKTSDVTTALLSNVIVGTTVTALPASDATFSQLPPSDV
jgi:hypothetical protein